MVRRGGSASSPCRLSVACTGSQATPPLPARGAPPAHLRHVLSRPLSTAQLLLICIVPLLGVPLTGLAVSAQQRSSTHSGYIVRLRQTAGETSINADNGTAAIAPGLKAIGTSPSGLFLVTNDDAGAPSADETVSAEAYTLMSPCAALENVAELCEPNAPITIDLTTNDPMAPDQWALAKIGSAAAWDYSVGSSAVAIAVLDTGIDLTHPDLVPNLWRNPREIPGNGVDDDGNGYVDDIHGINSMNDSGNPQDDNGHGTHVAGTIGARGGNGIGVSGVSQQIALIGAKALDLNGAGTVFDAIKALEYLLTLKQSGRVNLVAVNASWGTSFASQALSEVISRMHSAGILLITAAGNSGRDLTVSPYYPSSYGLPNIIPVAAIDSTGGLAPFSNFGPGVVHIAAPGVAILSTARNGGYVRLSGTSMAAPHLSGALGLLAAARPNLTGLALKDLLLFTTDRESRLSPSVTEARTLNVGTILSRALTGAIPSPAPTSTPAPVAVPTTTLSVVVHADELYSAQFLLEGAATETIQPVLKFVRTSCKLPARRIQKNPPTTVTIPAPKGFRVARALLRTRSGTELTAQRRLLIILKAPRRQRINGKIWRNERRLRAWCRAR